MSEEIATADANLREIARLRVELRLLRNRPAVEAELVERGAELLVVLADAPAELVRPNSAPDTLRAVLAEVVRLRARIDRAASHLPGRPDLAEQILSEVLK